MRYIHLKFTIPAKKSLTHFLNDAGKVIGSNANLPTNYYQFRTGRTDSLSVVSLFEIEEKSGKNYNTPIKLAYWLCYAYLKLYNRPELLYRIFTYLASNQAKKKHPTSDWVGLDNEAIAFIRRTMAEGMKSVS